MTSPTPPERQHTSSVEGEPAAIHVNRLVSQVRSWLENERQRQKEIRGKRRAAKRAMHLALYPHHHQQPPNDLEPTDNTADIPESLDPSDDDDDGDDDDPEAQASESLNDLEAILASVHIRGASSSGRKSRPRSLIGNASDTDYASDGEPAVPTCEVRLSAVEEVGAEEFKRQILTLAHTLRCKGWRRVPLERFRDVTAERMAGALTNAVYVVSPPQDICPPTHDASDSHVSVGSTSSAKPLSKLLLRIYKPQVLHLIDREAELGVLRRLARKRIGPRLLGTFENGRFEEFFDARTLTKEDLRAPEISRHIAKRLKELHESIELEDWERSVGPISWCSWYKWVPRTRGIMAIVDAKGNLGKNGYVCGCRWDKFETAVEKYRGWLCARYGGEDNMKKQMVFAHNDTQYGNIMRLQTSSKMPSDEHRQLVVIDFEYAGANLPGFEFANHFCEWMGDYHDPSTAHFMDQTRFPTPHEQRNFLRAYAEHSLSSSSPSILSSTVDASTPGASPEEGEAAHQREVEREVERLEDEARVWRSMSNAMWCAWAIIQSEIPGGEIEKADPKDGDGDLGGLASEEVRVATGDTGSKRAEEADGGASGEFDYLAYAQQRALLFWGDMLTLGIMTREEVGEEAVEKAKTIPP